MAADSKTKSQGIVSWPEDERPRERLLSRGPQGLTDAELLGILLDRGANKIETNRIHGVVHFQLVR